MPELLPDPHIAQLVQLGGNKLPKNLRNRQEEADHDLLRVRNWIDSRTAVLYAEAFWSGTKSADIKATYLFTIEFDANGKPRVIKTDKFKDKS